MNFNRYTWMAAVLGTAAVSGLVGCHKDNVNGLGAASISVKALSLADVSTVSVVVQGGTMPSAISVPLVKQGQQYSAVVSSLPVGANYTFTASAKDASNNELYHGVVSNQAIVKGQTANIVINLNQVAPGVGITNEAPVIDSISATSLTVPASSTATIAASAHDPDAGQTALMTWSWTSTCGTLGAPTNTTGSDTVKGTSTVIFTAPASAPAVGCSVNLTVTDANGVLKNVASLTIQVAAGAGTGNAKIVANLDTFPVISALQGTPVPLHVGVPSTLTVTASDADNDALNYLWTSPDCTGTFGSATAASTTFTLTTAPASANCTFLVRVDDGNFPDGTPKGGVITNHLSAPVGSPTVSVSGSPVFGYDYQSKDTLAAGDVVNLAIVANQGCAGGTISLGWVASDSTVLGSTTPAAIGLDPTLFNASAATYTAPAGFGAPVTVTVTATCSLPGAGTATHAFTLNPLVSFCSGKADNTDCTASQANKCNTAVCVSQVCTVQAPVVCSQTGVAACKQNTCVPATGLCTAVVNAPDNSTCNDSNACTSGELCTAGTCGGGTTVACPAGNACQVASCAPATGCGFTALVCPAGDVCNTGSCDATTGCKLTPVTCPVGQSCVVAQGGCVTPSGPALCAAPTYANKWVPPLSGLATNAAGTPWTVGQIYNPFDFGAGSVVSSGSADIYLNKVDPATGLATASFTFGDVGGKDQVASGVTVASNGNVGMVGYFTGEIDFDANNSDGSGASGVPGTAGLDFLANASAIPFYALIDGTSSGTFATPIKVHMVDVGTGALLGVGSNPTQSAFAICGKTSKGIPAYSASGATKGVITGGTCNSTGGTTGTLGFGCPGGGMDIVVAKIDAATGAVIWGRQFGGASDQICESVAIDNNGDVIISGAYTGTLNFSSTVTLPVVSDSTLGLLYVAKLSSANGTPLAAATWGTAGRSDAFSLTTDASNNIVFGGSLGGNVDFGGGVSITNAGLTDAFVAKLTTALAPVWAKSFGDANYDQTVKSIATSSNGDVYFGGSFKGTMPALGLTDSSNSALDAYSAHLAAADGSVVCASSYGDASGAQAISFVTVARTATGALADSVMAGGAFSSQIQLGSSLLDTGSASVSASFITRLK